MQKDFSADPRMADYVERVFGGEDAQLAEIRARALAAGLPEIHVGKMDGLHLEVLARAFGAKKVVEIGTLAGYSGVCLLRGMGEGAKLYTFEAVEKHAEVARETFQRAKVSERVEIFVGRALDRLAEIEAAGPFDLVFVDADKLSYPHYLAWAGKNLKPGGVLLGDNAFLFGRVVGDPTPEDAPSVRAMLSFNDALANGGRFRATMLPTGEGLAMGVKIR
jgi:caffeoyl-CoA O-methyltransferase